MSNFRDFDSMADEKSGRPEFVLAGQKWECRAKLPWRRFVSFMNKLEEGDTSERIDEFFSFALLQQYREPFQTMLDSMDEDDDKVASPTQVNSLMEWLMETYSGKVQESPENSLDGQPTTGQSLKTKSLKSTGAKS